MSIPVALQLFTVRTETAVDFIGTLEKVAEIGYKGVEFAGYGDIPASQMKAALDRLGLKAVGSHVRWELLNEKLDEFIQYNLEIGSKYVICPRAPLTTSEEIKVNSKLLIGMAESCKAKGLKFGYHNHSQEFVKIDGEYAMDMFYKLTDPDLMKAEFDTGWISVAGVDAAAYIRKYAGRCMLIHLKDFEPGIRDIMDDVIKGVAPYPKVGENITEIGNGIVPIAEIAAASKDIGAEWFIVEQDFSKHPPLESAKISYENLKKLKIV